MKTKLILCYSISVFAVLFWIILLQKTFPSDHENSNTYTVFSFLILALWMVFGIILFVRKKGHLGISTFVLLTILSFVLVFYFFPWIKGYNAFGLIQDYSKKRNGLKNIKTEWIYSLPKRVEFYPQIDLAQRKFVEDIKPKKCFLLQSFYYDSLQVQNYIHQ
jgi:hypothetical protein